MQEMQIISTDGKLERKHQKVKGQILITNVSEKGNVQTNGQGEVIVEQSPNQIDRYHKKIAQNSVESGRGKVQNITKNSTTWFKRKVHANEPSGKEIIAHSNNAKRKRVQMSKKENDKKHFNKKLNGTKAEPVRPSKIHQSFKHNISRRLIPQKAYFDT